MITLLVPFLKEAAFSSRHEAFAGVLVAHTFHLLSVLMLHELTEAVCSKDSIATRSKFAFLAASLHIVSPAGIFLSAPYAESSFSFLTFLGLFVYAKAMIGSDLKKSYAQREIMVLASGIIFGISTTFRGNGLLSGLVFVYDAVDSLNCILRSRDVRSNCSKLVTACVSGSLMACVAVTPQYLAYSEYCYRGEVSEYARPWCLDWPPSIYAWVQREYW